MINDHFRCTENDQKRTLVTPWTGPVSGGREALEVDDEDARPPLHRVPLEAPRPGLAAAAGRLLVAVEGLLCDANGGRETVREGND